MTHICVSKLSFIGSDYDLSPDRRQVIIWINAGILLIRALGTNFNEILIEINTFSFKKNALKNVVCEMASISSRPQWVNIASFKGLSDMLESRQYRGYQLLTKHDVRYSSTKKTPLIGISWTHAHSKYMSIMLLFSDTIHHSIYIWYILCRNRYINGDKQSIFIL